MKLIGRTVPEYHLWISIAIALCALALRLPNVGSASLWLDDAWVALVARMRADQLAQVGMTSLGFNAIQWAWFKLVGFSEVSAQFVPLASACLGPVALYALALRKSLSPVAGIVAALVLVVAPMHVQYSAAVKQYTLEALLTVFLIWRSWSVLELPSRKNIVILAMVALFSALVSSITVFIVVPAVCIPAAYIVWTRRPDRWEIACIAGITVLLAGAWVLFATRDYGDPFLRQFWSPWFVTRDQGLSGVMASTKRLAELFAAGLTPRRFRWVVVAAAAATALAVRRRPLLTAVLWSPFVLFYLASLVGRAPLGAGRTDVFLFPLAAVLAALATDELLRAFQTSRSKFVSLALIAVVIVSIVRGARQAVPNHPEEDLRPLAQQVGRQRAEGDVIILYPWAKFAFFLYSGMPFSIPSRQERPYEVPYALAAPGVISLDQNLEDHSREIDQQLGTPKRIWLVASHILYQGGADIEAIRSHLAHLGYHPDHKEERADAFIELWLPSDSLETDASPPQ